MDSYSLVVDPVFDLEAARESSWVPRDVVYDHVPVVTIDDMEIHPKCREAQLVSIFSVPYIFDSGTTGLNKGFPFAESTHSKGEAARVGDQGVVEYGLFENFGLRCGLGLLEVCPHVHPGSKNVFPERTCRNPTLAKCGGEAQHFQSWGLGVLWDSRMFRVRQQGPKLLALKRS